MMRIALLFFLTFLLSCSGGSSSSSGAGNGGEGSPSCSVQNIENSLDQSLVGLTANADFSFYLEREDGRVYLYNRGSSTMQSVYESASTSKWISAAIILWVLDKVDGFDLTDQISEHYNWAMPTQDPLYQINLDQLLSFTSAQLFTIRNSN